MAKNTREKAKKIAENKDRRPYATARHIRMSPYKVRRALTLIRGKSVNEAAAILGHDDGLRAVAAYPPVGVDRNYCFHMIPSSFIPKSSRFRRRRVFSL